MYLLQSLLILACLTKYTLSVDESYSVEEPSGNQVELERKWCSYEVDSFDCLNINCNGVRRIKVMPESIHEFFTNSNESTPTTTAATNILCSLDLTETGINQVSAKTFESFDVFLFSLIKQNSNQTNTNLKLSLSHIEEIKHFKLPVYLNFVLLIRDSNVKYVQPKALSSNNQLELNLIGNGYS